MAKSPSVMILSGTEGFLRRRELQRAISTARAAGRAVERLEGTDREAIAELVEGGMFGGATLGVISKPAKVDTELIEQHLAESDGTVTLLLHQEGKIRKGSKLAKLADKVGKRFRLESNRPDQAYKLEEYATKFVVNEASRLGVTIGTDLAEALVTKVGSDLGVLHFELVKVEAYMAATGGGKTVTPPQLMATMVRMGEANVAPLVDAMGKANVRRVIRELDTLHANYAGEAPGRTLLVCGWVGSAAIRWLHSAALHEDGASPDEASSRMGRHPYIYKKFDLPVARRWGQRRLAQLVKKVSRVEMAAKQGHIDPWVELECALIGSCRAVAGRG